MATPSLLHDWLIPDWPAPAQVRALCTTRNGGVSAAPHDSLNLGLGTQDAPQAVAANWQRLQAALQAMQPDGQPVHPVRLRQIHGTAVLPIERATPDQQAADASTTSAAGVACVVMAADCLPVLLTNRAGTRVAAAHAGWRGLAGGVLENVLQSFRAQTIAGQAMTAIESEAKNAGNAETVMAWIGPGIGAQAFEVGPEVRAAFVAHDPAAAQHFQARPGKASCGGDKYLADLAALARQRLRAAGVTSIHGNDSSKAWCTVANASRFFSYRRDHRVLGGSGRMAALIWRCG